MTSREHASRFSRRELLAAAGGALVVAIAPLGLRRRVLVRRSIPVMGTVANVLVAHDRPDVAERAIDLAFERLRWVDRTMSRFQDASDVGRVNRLATREAVPVDPATAAVLDASLRLAERTDGEFDPGLARVMEVWDPGRRTRPPEPEAFARFAGKRLYRGVVLDRFRGEPVVRLDDRDLGIDLGGIAKGFAVDLAFESVRDAGLSDFVVDAGGDLRGCGRSADGDRWRVGVRSPNEPGRLAAELELPTAGAAIATSGDYAQGFGYGGRRYHHILDPASAAPRLATSHSLTVRAATCLEADAIATAAFGRSSEAAVRFVQRTGATAEVARVL